MNVTRDNLKKLIEKHQWPCVSIFMSMHRSGEKSQQDPIRFKNLIEEAEKQLISGGLRAPEAREFLEPVQKVLKGDLFRQHENDGLAMFRLAIMIALCVILIKFIEKAL